MRLNNFTWITSRNIFVIWWHSRSGLTIVLCGRDSSFHTCYCNVCLFLNNLSLITQPNKKNNRNSFAKTVICLICRYPMSCRRVFWFCCCSNYALCIMYRDCFFFVQMSIFLYLVLSSSTEIYKKGGKCNELHILIRTKFCASCPFLQIQFNARPFYLNKKDQLTEYKQKKNNKKQIRNDKKNTHTKTSRSQFWKPCIMLWYFYSICMTIFPRNKCIYTVIVMWATLFTIFRTKTNQQYK